MSTNSAIEKLLAVARNEIGYLEKETNSNLDDKTANVGNKNFTKYARDLDNLNIYNGKKNGYAWCDMFVDWCFITAFGKEKALEIIFQPVPSYGATCTMSAEYYKEHGRFYTADPKAGDQIFFTKDGGKTSYHTGIVEKVENGRVYTIEGNTSSAAGVVENGGAVRDKSYSLSYSQIGGYGRPKYEAVDNIQSSSIQQSIIVVAAPIQYSNIKTGTVVDANAVYLRSGPNTVYPTVGVVNKDAALYINGSNKDRTWYKIKTAENKDGWIRSTYVSIHETVTIAKSGKVISSGSLNVRKGSSTSCAVIGYLKKDEIVTIIGANTDKTWYNIKTDKYPNGWVSAKYIKIVETTTKEYKTTTTALYLRSGRGASYTAITAIPKGTLVEVSELESNWYKVKYNDFIGYSNAKYLK